MGRDVAERVKEYILDDRPQRLKSYIKKHKVDLTDIRLKKNRNMLHYCCKCGSGTVFRYLLTEGLDAHHVDRDENTPLHLALKRALDDEKNGKSQQATESYNDLILPYIQRFPKLLDARNQHDESCRELLRQLVECRETAMPSCKRSASPESSPENREDDRWWRDKLAEEYRYEYQDTWGQYEQGFQESYSDRETYDDWAERIQHEYRSKQRAQEASYRATSSKKQKTSHKPSQTQAGPENLEDIRAKMREKFEKKSKENDSMKILKERMNYERKYKEILDTSDKGRLGFEDIPWPSTKGDNFDMAVLFEGMDKGDNMYKKYLRDQIIRWHPDKFMQRFGEHLIEKDKKIIIERVTKLSQSLNQLK